MVEWHFPNRCTRQFGWQQMIPEMGSTCTRLHGISRKGDWSGNYETMHQESIAKWENRMSKIVEPGLSFCGLMSFEDEYFEWYNAITRRIITPLSQTVNDDYKDHHYYYLTAADFQILTQTSMVTYNTTEQMISNMPDDIPLAQNAMIEKMRNMSLNSLTNNYLSIKQEDIVQEIKKLYTILLSWYSSFSSIASMAFFLMKKSFAGAGSGTGSVAGAGSGTGSAAGAGDGAGSAACAGDATGSATGAGDDAGSVAGTRGAAPSKLLKFDILLLI
ncbi:hypothetical protein KSS87_000021 [Heliosperma pusillum]|nr:hypothetical protein KSS87_000021 [Heliosperma pusillum]